MSACAVWAWILAVVAIVATGFAYRYKNLANKMKTRARIYMRYVPIDQLTAQLLSRTFSRSIDAICLSMKVIHHVIH